MLISFLDGELNATERERVRSHLTGCWTCRGRLEEMEEQIQAFLGEREQFLPDPKTLESAPVEQFRERLNRHARERAQQEPVWARFYAALRRQLLPVGHFVREYRRPVLALIVIAILITTDLLNTTLSAETILLNAERYDTNHQAAAGEIALKSVHVERISLRDNTRTDLGEIAIAADSDTRRLFVGTSLDPSKKSGTVVSETGADSGNALRQLPAMVAVMPPPVMDYLARQDWVPEVSVTEFRHLVTGRKNSAESAKRDGGEFELHFPFAAGHASTITEALLRVDATSYAARQMSIRTSDSSGRWEYRFTQEESAAAPRTAEWAMLFNAPEGGLSSRPAIAAVPNLPATRVTPLTYASSRATNGEVAVATTLHRLGVCMGEELYLIPMSDGSLLAQGVVDRAERRDTIRKAVLALNLPVAVRVYTPAELKSGAELYNPPEAAVSRLAAASPVTLADFSSQQMPLYGRLAVEFSKNGSSDEEVNRKVAAFSNEIVGLSRQALLHAWALKRLDGEFSGQRAVYLRAASLQQLEQIRQDHQHQLTRLARRQAELLGPFLDRESIPAASQSVSQDSETLLRLAEQQSMLVRQLFTVSSEASDPQSGLQHLMATLRQMSR